MQVYENEGRYPLTKGDDKKSLKKIDGVFQIFSKPLTFGQEN